MLTRALISAGCHGDGGHRQAMDDLDFNGKPERIVLRRSLPHAHHWPDLERIRGAMEDAGYEVTTLGIRRRRPFVKASQLRVGHAKSALEADRNTDRAEAIIEAEAHVTVVYGEFVQDPQHRERIFAELGLPAPKMEFYDGNAKYAN